MYMKRLDSEHINCFVETIQSIKEQGTTIPQKELPTHYIWLHVTENGITRAPTTAGEPGMLLNDLLNLIDESATHGASWMILFMDSKVDPESDIWKLCSWAQEIHEIKIGIHLKEEHILTWDSIPLNRFDKSDTFFMADESLLDSGSLMSFKEQGYTVCRANITDTDRDIPCSNTESIICAGVDGIMYCCGLVRGDSAYETGTIRSDTINQAMQNKANLQPLPSSLRNTQHGCDGCPPIVAQRFYEQQAAKS
jgi:hypothetical protein